MLGLHVGNAASKLCSHITHAEEVGLEKALDMSRESSVQIALVQLEFPGRPDVGLTV